MPEGVIFCTTTFRGMCDKSTLGMFSPQTFAPAMPSAWNGLSHIRMTRTLPSLAHCSNVFSFGSSSLTILFLLAIPSNASFPPTDTVLTPFQVLFSPWHLPSSKIIHILLLFFLFLVSTHSLSPPSLWQQPTRSLVL